MTKHIHNTSIHASGDGSHTLYSSQFNQFFHNPNGAIAESRHIFFETPGLKERLRSRDHFTIFEAGFGSGLNLLVLLDILHKMDHVPSVTFRSVEAYPISAEQAEELNHASLLELPGGIMSMADLFKQLRPGINEFQLTDQLKLELFIGKYSELPAPASPYDAIFFDPFSPDTNPDFWTPDVFKRLSEESRPDAILSTYCAASVARASMALAGWLPYRLPGALGKREMTVAVLSGNQFPKGSPVNAKRLAERYLRGDLALP